MKTVITRIVAHGGIRYKSGFYYHTSLHTHRGKQVIVRLEKTGLRVWDVDGRPVCLASDVTFPSAKPAEEGKLASD